MNMKPTRTYSQKADTPSIKPMPDLIPGMIKFGELNWIFSDGEAGGRPIAAAVARAVTTGGYFDRDIPAFRGDVAILHDFDLDGHIPDVLEINGINTKRVWLPKTEEEAHINVTCAKRALDALTNPKLLIISQPENFTRDTDGCIEEFFEEFDKILELCTQRGCYLLINSNEEFLPDGEMEALSNGRTSKRVKNYCVTYATNKHCKLANLWRIVFYLTEGLPEQLQFVLFDKRYGARQFHLERGAKPIWE